MLSSEEKLLQKRLSKGTRVTVGFSAGKVHQTWSCLIERNAWTHVSRLGLTSADKVLAFFLVLLLLRGCLLLSFFHGRETFLGMGPNHCRTRQSLFPEWRWKALCWGAEIHI